MSAQSHCWVYGSSWTTMIADICEKKKRHSQCGISWGSLGGRSALDYSVQLNKLKCQEHNASSILWKKSFPFFSLWRCWAAHYSCGYFNMCGNTEKCTHRAPLWPPSLWNKNKINTLLDGDLTKAKDFLSFIFRQVPWQSKRQAWLSTGGNGICVSQCWCLTWTKLQTDRINSKFFITVCHWQECASRLSCLLNQCFNAT